MPAPFEDLAGLDRLVHEPARLALLTALSSCASADFLFLQRLTGLSKGNLSSHLSKLEEGGLVQIEKSFVGKVPHTEASLTARGRAAIARHWSALDRLRAEAGAFRPPRRR
jgi:DNA-binding MarR family transcriptional regulator